MTVLSLENTREPLLFITVVFVLTDVFVHRGFAADTMTTPNNATLSSVFLSENKSDIFDENGDPMYTLSQKVIKNKFMKA